MRVVFLGDSLTEGVPGATYLSLLTELVAVDPRLNGTELVNAGRGGDTVFNLARRVISDVVPVAPDWVVIFIGANDCTSALRWRALPTPAVLRSRAYFTNQKSLHWPVTPSRYTHGLRILVDAIRNRTSARVAICTPAVVGESSRSRAWRLLDRYADAARQVAGERECALIDVHATFTRAVDELPSPPPVARLSRGALSLLGGMPVGEYSHLLGFCLTVDGIHFSHTGALIMADLLHDWLLRVASEEPLPRRLNV